MRASRLLTALPLSTVAAFFLWFGGFITSKVFDEYKDSADSTYLTIGGLSIAIGAMFAIGALLTVLGPSKKPYIWLLLALVALVASPLPYADMVGAPGYAVNGLLALLAVGSFIAFAAGTHARSGPPSRSSL